MVDPDIDHSLIKDSGKAGSDTVEFDHEASGNRERLILKGELKHGNSDLVYNEVVSIFSRGITEVLLDFRDLAYIDTTGLQSLVRVYKYVQADPGRKFKILVQNGELIEILQTCRFDKFIDITGDANVWTCEW